MRRIYNSKAFWIVISLFLSLMMWVYVTSQENDEIKQTFRGVRVELVGESVLKENKGMVVTDLSTSTVSVEITGPRRIVSALSAEKLSAQIDVSKLTTSSYASMQYSISYPNGTDTSNLTVNRKVPDTVNFTVSKLSTKTIPVRGSFDGSIAEGYTAEPVVFEPSEITISGPEAYLKDIEYAWVSFASENVTTSYSADVGFDLCDEDGEDAVTTDVTCSTDVIKATLPILQVKELPLVVNLIYGSGANESNTKVTIEPETITLAGDSAILSSMNNVPVVTIDTKDFASTFSDTFTITYDNSLTNLEGVTEAEVKVEIDGLTVKTFTVRNIQVRNLTDGYEATILTRSIPVKIRGTAEQLEQLTADDLVAVADLYDYELTTGMNMVPVKIQVDGSVDAGAIGGAYTAAIDLQKAG